MGKAGNYNYFWLTFGGQGTNSKGWEVSAEQDVLDAGAKGAAFDMEGGVQRDAVFKWVAEMRKKHPEWTYVHTEASNPSPNPHLNPNHRPNPNPNPDPNQVHVPQAHDSPIPYKPENQGLPDFVAPMLYYSNFDSYPDMDISKKVRHTPDPDPDPNPTLTLTLTLTLTRARVRTSAPARASTRPSMPCCA